MHTGAACTPLVKIGDKVTIGQKIGDSSSPVSAPLHASVSGEVVAIEPYSNPAGTKIQSIIVENDGLDIMHESVRPYGSVESLPVEELFQIVRECGIVGAGGAAYPTHAKIKFAQNKTDILIINGCECEPCLTGDYRLMLEAPEEIVGGVRVLMKLLNVDRAVIAVESNKYDAAESVRRTLPRGGPVRVKVLPTRYPQGAEKQLIKSVSGREVPPGSAAASMGSVIFNVETTAAIHRAVTTGLPFFQRVVTVAGNAVANAKNLRVRIGTPFEELFAATGGFRETPHKIIIGGPMMGLAQHNLRAPVTKGSCGLLAFTDSIAIPPSTPCIRCGRCVQHCPMRLLPVSLYVLEQNNKLRELEKLHIDDCIECGCCNCPARLHLVQSVRAAKLRLNA
jgi:electron transport complex protein RnfC